MMHMILYNPDDLGFKRSYDIKIMQKNISVIVKV